MSGKLNWSHYCELLSISDKEKRSFYEKEAVNAGWSVREMKRQIDSSLFERLLLSRSDANKEQVLALAEKGVDYAKPEDIKGCIISSVVPPVTRALQGAARLLTGKEPLVVGGNVRCRVPVKIKHPETLGADLLTAAVGALDAYKPPMLLLDMGTATTITVLDGEGAIRGGAILPGANLSLSALAGGTALLPDIPLAVPEKAIGTDTLSCMQSGCVLGAALLLDGMIDRMTQELGQGTTVVATGGIAPVIAPACKHKMHMSGDLILRGLAVLYEQNR